MRPTFADGVVFVYNFAVVLSGAYATRYFQIEDRPVLFAVSFGFAVFWTIYFRYGMVSRLSEHFAAESAEEPTEDV